MKIEQLLERISYTLVQGDEEKEITGICHDNRVVKEGDAFICIKGARFDTHNGVKEIAAKGAALIVVEREVEAVEGAAVVLVEDTRKVLPLLACAWYGYPAEKMTTIGITGSKGKTTATHMLADILRSGGYQVGTIGTNGAIIGEEIYELNNTTPDPMELQMYLGMMAKAGCTHVVIEVSSQGMKQHRVDGFTFDYSIWTNISEGDHIGPNEHADFAEYLACKAQLISQSRLGFVNRDDAHADAFLAQVTSPCQLYSVGGEADYSASQVEKTFADGKPGLAFHVTGKNGLDADIAVNQPGEFNVYNALAAICVADAIGVTPEQMNCALTQMNIKGRFDIVYDSEEFKVCVDFAHNGYSTRNHLEALREYRPKRLVCIFGADGNRSKSRRYEMGEAAGRLADFSIVTAGHNRWETFEQILADIHVGLDKTEGSYIVIPKRQDAIRYAITHAQPGDLITILGLGHETYQEEGGVKYPHSDTEFVKQVVRELGLLDCVIK